MEFVLSIGSALGVLLLGIMSPGPSFVLVARTSIAVSRLDGLVTAIGMGLGSMLFALLAIVGLQTVLESVPWLYMLLKVMGGMYLVYLAYQLWKGAKASINLENAARQDQSQLRKSFATGLVTQLSNPKTAIFYGSIFAALLPQTISKQEMLALSILIFALETSWYAIVACVLSSASPRALYLRSKTMVDWLASGIVGVLGLKLILTTD